MTQKFLQYKIDKWNRLSFRDKQMNFMSALKAASSIMQGSKISKNQLCEYAEEILEHFYEFEQFQKPNINASPVKQSLDDKANQEIESLKEEPFQ